MNILIFGATGPSGQQLVRLALARGHCVTAFVRDPAKLDIQHEQLKIATGDITDAASVRAAMPGHQAVLSALGSVPKKPDTSLSDGTRNIIAAMGENGIRRLLVITSMGVGDSNHQMPFIFRLLTWSIIKHAWKDKQVQEKAIMASDTDWTIARPGHLIDGEHTGKVREIDASAPAPKPNKIHRADVAGWMLDKLEDTASFGKAITLVGDYPQESKG